MLENERISHQGILEGPFKSTQDRCQKVRRVLAIQDSTSVRVLHKDLYDQVKETGGANGIIVHSTIAVDGDSGEVLGLADQIYWTRSKDGPGHATRNQRAHEHKESYKWTQASKRLSHRGQIDVIAVGDREADVYEFLEHLVSVGQRFVVRCCANRRTNKEGGHVYETARDAPILGYREVLIEQRGGQPAGGMQVKRAARRRETIALKIQATQTKILPPRIRKIEGAEPMTVNIVRVSSPPFTDKTKGSKELREWILLTSEPVSNLQEAVQIVKDYEHRWIIEEFHKCWKSGCRIEGRPLHRFTTVARMMAITAAIAVRILQLRDIAHGRTKDSLCSVFLSKEEWTCLWLSTEAKRLPASPPSARWAARALAQLGGWFDTKRTGKIGWPTLWDGYLQLETLAAGYALAKAAARTTAEM